MNKYFKKVININILMEILKQYWNTLKNTEKLIKVAYFIYNTMSLEYAIEKSQLTRVV